MTQILTPWLRGNPTIIGVYQVRFRNSHGWFPTQTKWYSKWNGEKWCRISVVPDIAASNTDKSRMACEGYVMQWRGLANDPSLEAAK